MPDNGQSVLDEPTETRVEKFVLSKTSQGNLGKITDMNTAPIFLPGKIAEGLTITKISSIVNDFNELFKSFWGKDTKKYPIWGSLTLILKNLEDVTFNPKPPPGSQDASTVKTDNAHKEAVQKDYTEITFEILDVLRESIIPHKWAKDYITKAKAIQVKDKLSTVYVEIAYGLAEVMEFLSTTSHTATVERKDWEPILERCHQRAHRARKALEWVELDVLFSSIVDSECKCSPGQPGRRPGRRGN